jgi:hypothetical protein
MQAYYDLPGYPQTRSTSGSKDVVSQFGFQLASLCPPVCPCVREP